MKNIVLYLALALFSGVAFSFNCSEATKNVNEAYNLRQMMTVAGIAETLMTGMNQHIKVLEVEAQRCNSTNSTSSWANLTSLRTCVNSIISTNSARKSIETEKKKMREDAKVIAKHEADIANFSKQVENICPAEIQCAFAKVEIKFAEDALNAQKNRFTPDQKIIGRLENTLAEMKVRITTTCNKTEVCAFSKSEIKKSEDAIVAQKNRMSPNQMVIERLQNDINYLKMILYSICPHEEICTFVKGEVVKARAEITSQKNRFTPDQKIIAKLEEEIDGFREGVVSLCNTTEICSFVEAELKVVEKEYTEEKRKLSPKAQVLAKLEDSFMKLKTVQSQQCTSSSGFMRLAEVAVRSGRFLSKLLRH